MDPAPQPLDILLNWFQNISILVMLVLLYNFIPDRFFMHRDRIYSIYVGLIFTFAAVIGIVMPWSGTEHPSIGINGILVPLAGMVGGPISAAIITGILLIIQVPVNSAGVCFPDTLIILTAGIIGLVFYIAREKRLFRLEPVHELLALSSVFSILTIVIMTLFLLIQVRPSRFRMHPLLRFLRSQASFLSVFSSLGLLSGQLIANGMMNMNYSVTRSTLRHWCRNELQISNG